MEISVRSIGSREPDPQHATEIILENIRQKELFEIALIYEQKLTQKSKRITELSKVIEVIRILGDGWSPSPRTSDRSWRSRSRSTTNSGSRSGDHP
jgi:hypothetical protein